MENKNDKEDILLIERKLNVTESDMQICDINFKNLELYNLFEETFYKVETEKVVSTREKKM